MKFNRVKALVVEDDPIFRNEIKSALLQSLELTFASSLLEARNLALSGGFEIILLDKNLPDGSGLELIPELKMMNPYSVILMLTADPTDSSIQEALNRGASDYLVKSVRLKHELPGRIQVAEGRLAIEHRCKKAESIAAEFFSTEIIGRSSALQEIRNQIKIFAQSGVNVLISGETGTGKELIAKALNLATNNRERPFVTINCGAISPHLIESELFGHTRGAFTGATSEKEGKIEQANGGDLFLDEIGELPLSLQPKLLRVLQDGEFYRVGSNQKRISNLRVISATNRNLEEMVKFASFREDLLFRVNGTEIMTTPLRDRPEDIGDLIQYFLYKSEGARFSIEEAAVKELKSETWPGNIRELRNRIGSGIALCKARGSTELLRSDVASVRSRKPKSESGIVLSTLNNHRLLGKEDYRNALVRLEKEFLKEVLKGNHGNVVSTANELNLSQATLYRKLKEFGLAKPKRLSGSDT